MSPPTLTRPSWERVHAWAAAAGCARAGPLTRAACRRAKFGPYLAKSQRGMFWANGWPQEPPTCPYPGHCSEHHRWPGKETWSPSQRPMGHLGVGLSGGEKGAWTMASDAVPAADQNHHWHSPLRPGHPNTRPAHPQPSGAIRRGGRTQFRIPSWGHRNCPHSSCLQAWSQLATFSS